jgi:[ribosomal protein S18]-alanine N-acetyltransferase
MSVADPAPIVPPDGVVVDAASTSDADAIRGLDGLSASTLATLDADLASDERWYLVARSADGDVVGALGLAMAVDEAHVLDLAVAPAWRRQGIGAVLVDRARTMARDELGATAMTMEVRQGNAAARGLYRRLGFREEGRRPGYYPDGGPDGGREAAVLLWDRDLGARTTADAGAASRADAATD